MDTRKHPKLRLCPQFVMLMRSEEEEEKKKKPLKFNLLSISELGEPLHLDITNAATLQGSALSHTCLCQAHQYPTLEDLSISDDDAGIVASFSVSKHYSMALWGGWGWESSLMAIGKRKS